MNVNWGECYYDHYAKFLGTPVERQVFRKDDQSPSIQILAYDGVFKGCRVFCSLGLTHYSSEVSAVGEVVLPLDAGWEDVPSLLANVLFYIVQKPMSLGWGMSISGIDNISPEFTRAFNKTALYFTTPYGFPQDFNRVDCQTGVGDMYLAFFISASEHAFFTTHGAEQFENLLEVHNVDPFTLQRPTCV